MNPPCPKHHDPDHMFGSPVYEQDDKLWIGQQQPLHWAIHAVGHGLFTSDHKLEVDSPVTPGKPRFEV